jgi:hypothetical protein
MSKRINQIEEKLKGITLEGFEYYLANAHRVA